VDKGEYIGMDDNHNVYAAELTATQMVLVEENIDDYTNVHVFTDNQSAINAVQPRRQSGQYIIKEILDVISRIHDSKPTCPVHLEWVPGHMNIEGNEQADKATKAAAAPNTAFTTTRMRSAQYTSIQSMTNAEWKTTGRERARRLRSISQFPVTTTGPKLYRTLQQRKHVVGISQIRAYEQGTAT
jgi:ribonuclease HI